MIQSKTAAQVAAEMSDAAQSHAEAIKAASRARGFGVLSVSDSSERLWNWYNSVFTARGEKDAKIVTVLTRLHESDSRKFREAPVVEIKITDPDMIERITGDRLSFTVDCDDETAEEIRNRAFMGRWPQADTEL